MKTSATAKFVGTSARKTGLVAGLIRGRRAADAQIILANANKRATVPVGKALNSAIANAENNFNARVRDLIVESVLIGPGPSLKRSRPRGKGSAAPILKRSSHITVVLTDNKPTASLGRAKDEAVVSELPATSTDAAKKSEAKKEVK